MPLVACRMDSRPVAVMAVASVASIAPWDPVASMVCSALSGRTWARADEEELRTPLARPALELCSPKKPRSPSDTGLSIAKTEYWAKNCERQLTSAPRERAAARSGANRHAAPFLAAQAASSLTFEGRPPPKPFVMADEESKQGEEAKPNTMQLKVVSQDGTEGVLLLPHVPPLCTHAQWLPSSLSAGDRQ